MIPVFKAVHADMSAQADRSFIYPTSGTVNDKGGHGLHGLPYGLGDDSWWYNIRPAKYLVLLAPAISLKWKLGKCRFETAEVVGCYDYADEAAMHMAHITDWWQTSGPTELLQQTTHEHWKTLIYLAQESDAVIQKRMAALAEGARTREQRWREQVSTGIAVPGWPVRTSQPQTVTIKQERK